MKRTILKVEIKHDQMKRDILAMAGSLSAFAIRNGVSTNYLCEILNGKKIPIIEKVDEITNALYKPPGYYYAAPPTEKSWEFQSSGHKKDPTAAPEKGGGSTGNTEKILFNFSKQTYERMKDQEGLLEDIKASNDLILSAIKTQTTLMARLLAIWEGKGEKNA